MDEPIRDAVQALCPGIGETLSSLILCGPATGASGAGIKDCDASPRADLVSQKRNSRRKVNLASTSNRPRSAPKNGFQPSPAVLWIAPPVKCSLTLPFVPRRCCCVPTAPSRSLLSVRGLHTHLLIVSFVPWCCSCTPFARSTSLCTGNGPYLSCSPSPPRRGAAFARCQYQANGTAPRPARGPCGREQP